MLCKLNKMFVLGKNFRVSAAIAVFGVACHLYVDRGCSLGIDPNTLAYTHFDCSKPVLDYLLSTHRIESSGRSVG